MPRNEKNLSRTMCRLVIHEKRRKKKEKEEKTKTVK
jgi:hypothetical protein